MRPGCDRPAGARLTYDPVACELWLDPITTPSRAPVQELCDFHVERLTVPRGWVATDRRKVADDEPPEPEKVADDESPEPEPEPASPNLEDGAGEGADEGDEAVPTRLPTGSSMLARAFAWTGPQHSVLTTPVGTESEEDGSQG